MTGWRHSQWTRVYERPERRPEHFEKTLPARSVFSKCSLLSRKLEMLLSGAPLLHYSRDGDMDYRYEMFQKESTSATIHKKSGLGGLVLIGKPGPDLFFLRFVNTELLAGRFWRVRFNRRNGNASKREKHFTDVVFAGMNVTSLADDKLESFSSTEKGWGGVVLCFLGQFTLSICPLEGSFTANQYKVSLRGFALILVITG